MPSAETNRQNGRKSSGPKTANGKQICSLAAVEHGIRSWSPCLPGETEEDWVHLQNGCIEYFQPMGTPEEQLVHAIAMTFLQMHRLNRREKEVSLPGARVDCFSPMEKEHVQQQIDAVLDGRGAELRKEITLLDNLIAALAALSTDAPETPLTQENAGQLLNWIVGVNVLQKHLGKGGPQVTMPATGWTVGSVREAVHELAGALSKSAEVLIANTLKRVTEERDEKRSNLKTAWHYIEHDGLPKSETAVLLNLYDRRLLNNLTRLYNLLERMQASRLGKPIVPTVPVDVTITQNGNGDA